MCQGGGVGIVKESGRHNQKGAHRRLDSLNVCRNSNALSFGEKRPNTCLFVPQNFHFSDFLFEQEQFNASSLFSLHGFFLSFFFSFNATGVGVFLFNVFDSLASPTQPHGSKAVCNPESYLFLTSPAFSKTVITSSPTRFVPIQNILRYSTDLNTEHFHGLTSPYLLPPLFRKRSDHGRSCLCR